MGGWDESKRDREIETEIVCVCVCDVRERIKIRVLVELSRQMHTEYVLERETDAATATAMLKTMVPDHRKPSVYAAVRQVDQRDILVCGCIFKFSTIISYAFRRLLLRLVKFRPLLKLSWLVYEGVVAAFWFETGQTQDRTTSSPYNPMRFCFCGDCFDHFAQRPVANRIPLSMWYFVWAHRRAYKLSRLLDNMQKGGVLSWYTQFRRCLLARASIDILINGGAKMSNPTVQTAIAKLRRLVDVEYRTLGPHGKWPSLRQLNADLVTTLLDLSIPIDYEMYPLLTSFIYGDDGVSTRDILGWASEFENTVRMANNIVSVNDAPASKKGTQLMEAGVVYSNPLFQEKIKRCVLLDIWG